MPLILSSMVVALAAVPVAGAATSTSNRHSNKVSCQAIGLAIPLVGKKDNIGVANKRPTPCRTKKAFLEHVTSSTTIPIHVNAVIGRTWYFGSRRRGKRAVALGRVAHAVIGVKKGKKTSIDVGAVSSKIIDSCVAKGGRMRLESSMKSYVLNLTVAGKKYSGSKTKKIVVPHLLTIWLNRTVKQGNTLIRRGVQIDLAGKPAVILGQAMVSAKAGACARR